MRAPETLDAPAMSGAVRCALPIAAGSAFLAGLDTTAVNLALPGIQHDLAAGLSEVGWVINAFSLFSAALLVTAGNLSDRLGRRRVFVTGLLAFAASSAACGVAPSALVLDVARAVQGASSAVVTASGLAVVATLYPSPARGRALGTYAALGASSFVVGPLVGGALTDLVGWRSVFFVNVPAALLLAVAARAILPTLADSQGRERPRFDHLGVVTFTVGLGALLYAALRGGEIGWMHAEVAVAAVLGIAGLVTFALVERRLHDGVVDLRLFRDRTFAGATAALALGAGAYFGMLVYLSLFLQGALRLDAFEAGLVFLPTIAPYMIMSPISGHLVTRFPGARVPTTGLALIAAGMVLLVVGVHAGAGLLGVAGGMVVTGLGTGLTVTPLTQLALDRVPASRSGMASGVLQTARPIGVTVGVTVLGLAVSGGVGVAGVSAVAAIAASLAAVAAVVAGLLIRPGIVR
ncbi:MFS transporter [Actinomycetospora endophytica]|uniref:MFS transporter n=1 Tax=Actinomycetospora endophytica TaxID=2291215 RepID=A0ABS8PMH6_9PSEU|nr:MFS transporter [Actinomycetospora endophytica]MCD2198174.1 MFS transporter [Actinomycetospora endophytica]